MRRGFTLIEILIAASVLGLGVLGIATLFAGAARQQQIASDQTESNRVARNIDALLSDRFAQFGGMALDDDPVLDAAGEPFFSRGQWHPLAAAPDGGVVAGRLDGTLLLDLTDDGAANQSSYGLAEGKPVVLYRAPWVDPDTEIIPTQAWNNPIPTPGLPGQPFDYNDMIACVNQDAVLREAPYGRLQPGFRVVVTFAQEFQDVGNQGQGPPSPTPEFRLEESSLRYEFSFANWRSVDVLQADPERWPRDPMPPEGDNNETDIVPGGQQDRFISLVRVDEMNGSGQVDAPGGTSAGSDSWIRIRVQRPDRNDAPVASIDDMFINMPDTPSGAGQGRRWIVREIRLEEPTYREDRLLSLSERISYREDEAFPGGRRPSRGAAVLYRRTLDGRDQLLTIAYTLEPLGRVRLEDDELPFVPPDTRERLYDTTQEATDYGLLSQVQLELGYDPNLLAYTLTATREEDQWAVQKDQILIVSTDDETRTDATIASRTDDPAPGADATVRVVRTRPDPGSGFLQAVLDDSPRVSPPRGGARSFLPNADGSETVDVWVWALRPVVRSAEGGDMDVEWRVRPTGSQVATLGGGS